jgi:TP901 family phage tail tape measure protein
MATSAGVRAGKAFVTIEAIDKTQIVLDKVAAKLRKFSDKLREIGMTALKFGAIGAIPGFFGAREFGGFEQVMADMQASAGLTADEFIRMRNAALAISAKSGMDPTNVARSMLELVKAGMPVEQILKGAGLAAAQFAKVAGVSAEKASTVMFDMMNAFGVSATHGANVLSAAADASSVSLEQLVDSMAMASSVGNLANQNIEDVSAALALLGKNGIKGSDAGTALKMSLLQLVAPTETGKKAFAELGLNVRDANGEMLPMRGIIERLSESLAGLDPATRDLRLRQLFGTDGIRVANILLRTGTKGWDEFLQKMLEAQTVSEKFRIMMDTLFGSLERLWSSVKRLAIALGETIAGPLGIVIKLLEYGVNQLTAWVGANQTLVAIVLLSSGGLVLFGASLIAVAAAAKVASVAIGGAAMFLRIFNGVTWLARAAVLGLIGTVYRLVRVLIWNVAIMGAYRVAVLAMRAALLLSSAGLMVLQGAVIAYSLAVKAASLATFLFTGAIGLAKSMVISFGVVNAVIGSMVAIFYGAVAVVMLFVKSLMLASALLWFFYSAGILVTAGVIAIFAVAIAGLVMLLTGFGPVIMSVISALVGAAGGGLAGAFAAVKIAFTSLIAAVDSNMNVFRELYAVFWEAWGGIMSAIKGNRMSQAMAIAMQYMKVAFLGLKQVMHDVIGVGRKLWVDLATAFQKAMIAATFAVKKGMLDMVVKIMEMMQGMLGDWGMNLIFGDQWKRGLAAIKTAAAVTEQTGKDRQAEADKEGSLRKQIVDAETRVAQADTAQEMAAALAELRKLLEQELIESVLDEFFPDDGTDGSAGVPDPGDMPQGVPDPANASGVMKAIDALERGSVEAARKAIENTMGLNPDLKKLVNLADSQLRELEEMNENMAGVGGV